MTGMRWVVAALAFAIPAHAAEKKVADAVAKAHSQIAKGRTDEALKTMEKLVRELPTAEAHTARARVQLRLGDAEAAAISAAEAVDQSASATPDVKADALVTQAALDLERGSASDAAAHARAAAAVAATPDTLAVLARALARGEDPTALDAAKRAVEAGPQSPAAHEAMGHALLAAARGEEATASFRKALELDVKRSSARVGLARALLVTDKPAEAVAEARQASEEEPLSGEAFAVLGTAIMAAAPEKDRAKAWSDAIEAAQEGAFHRPRNVVVLHAVARLLEAGGNDEHAAETYRKALQVDPDFLPAQIGLLDIDARRGDLSSVIPRAREICRIRPRQTPRVQFLLGKLLARKGEWAEAIEPLQKAASGMARDAEVHALLGTAYQFTGQSADALKAYEVAVTLAPGNNDYRTTYGLLLGLNGRHEQGIVELRKVTADPAYKGAAAWVNLGWLYRAVKPVRAAESAAAYETSLKIDPKNAQAFLGLGWAYVFGEKYDAAIDAFEKALALDKVTTGEAYNGIGWSYYFKRDIERAREAARQAQAANRPVKDLLVQIDKLEKGIQAAEDAKKALEAEAQRPQGPDVGALCNQIQHGSPAARASAARQLAKGGSAGADCLVYAVRNDASLDVRLAAAVALGNLGPAAGHEACVQLQGIAGGPNLYEAGPFATPEQMQNEVKYADLQKAARAAAASIGCP